MKRLTMENWLEPDPIMRVFVRWSQEGYRPTTKEDWAQPILEITLAPEVPLNVRKMFEVARGCMLYGCMFYPLFTLGSQQLYRVLDAAAYEKCVRGGLPASTKGSFHDRILELERAGMLTGWRLEQWRSARHLRNYSSHEVGQSIYDPGSAIWGLERAADMIHGLFVPGHVEQKERLGQRLDRLFDKSDRDDSR